MKKRNQLINAPYQLVDGKWNVGGYIFLTEPAALAYYHYLFK